MIFEPFWHKSEAGAGLGLAIAKELVKKHGGRIWVGGIDGSGRPSFYPSVTISLSLTDKLEAPASDLRERISFSSTRSVIDFSTARLRGLGRNMDNAERNTRPKRPPDAVAVSKSSARKHSCPVRDKDSRLDFSRPHLQQIGATATSSAGVRRSTTASCSKNHNLPGDLEAKIAAFVDRYNGRRYHESLNNLALADGYCGRGAKILREPERIKHITIQNRRLQHQMSDA